MLGNNNTTLFDIKEILAKIDISEKQKVAELGCGNFGFFVFPMAKLVGRQGLVYAVDIVKDYLKEIKRTAEKENMPQIKAIWTNLEIFKATKIETESIDAATLINVLNQSNKKLEILKEAARLLKTNGNLVIIEWKSSDLPLGPSPEKRVKPETIKEQASRLGLNVKEEFEAGPYHYGLILNKF